MSELHTAPIIDDADLADDVEIPARLAGAAGLLRITLAKIKLHISTALASFLVPPGGTAGQVLVKASVIDNDVDWADAKPFYWSPPLAADFNTLAGAIRSGTVAAVPTLADDADVGLHFLLNPDTAGTFTVKPMGRPIPVANQGGDFTITAHLKAGIVNNNDQCGIWAGDTATNKYVFFGLFCRGSYFNLQRASSNAGAWSDGTYSAFWGSNDVWLRIVIANQTTSYYVSADGKYWKLVYAAENLFAAPYKNYGVYGGGAIADSFNITIDHLSSEEYP